MSPKNLKKLNHSIIIYVLLVINKMEDEGKHNLKRAPYNCIQHCSRKIELSYDTTQNIMLPYPFPCFVFNDELVYIYMLKLK